MRVLFSNKGFERLREIIETLFENHEVRYADILESRIPWGGPKC